MLWQSQDVSCDWPGMQVSEVLTVLGLLHGSGCRVCVGGGWGVDAVRPTHSLRASFTAPRRRAYPVISRSASTAGTNRAV